MEQWDLFDEYGNRKYLTTSERQNYYKAIDKALSSNRDKRTFALMLYYTGCRISEALNVEVRHIDYTRKGVVFRTLKRKKKKAVYRFVPLPDRFLTKLDDVHRLKDFSRDGLTRKIWSFDRTTGWRAIKSIMDEATIEGTQATPKGLRHSFVIHHQELKTPDHIIQRWMGWASRDMMEVYGAAVGTEERVLAEKLWY